MRVTMHPGAELDLLTHEEVGKLMAEHEDRIIRRALAGVTHVRLPVLRATPASSAVTLGDGLNSSPVAGPEAGRAWSIMRLALDGLTTGATPDVINFYFNDVSTPPVWQLNGNNWGETFSRGQLVLRPGETLVAASSGTFAATGTITLTGEAWDLPAEMLAKLA